MVDQWARSSLDLHLPIDRGRGVRAGLERALRDAVRSGRLPPGTRLPSSRVLARDLGIARGTVTQAYEQLVAEGFLTSLPRSGVRVAPGPAGPPEPGPTLAGTWLPPVPGVDLRPGLPDLSLFPRREWLAATRQVLQTAPNSAFGYGAWSGHEELRATLAEYLGRARGVLTTADHIVVCAGYTHALQIIYRALRQIGASSVAFEDPFIADYPSFSRESGLQVAHVPVDQEGLVTDQLAGQDIVIVTPAHQYPLGVTLSPPRRTRLLEWAQRTGAYVVEDDYDGEFRYDRQPVGALQGLAPDRVIYAGTVSKTLAPGLRLAWLAVPTSLIPAFRQSAACDDNHVSVVDQLALARLIQTGDLDRHLRRCRARYRRRRDRLGAAVAERLPRTRLSGIAAGLHAVLYVPDADEADLCAHLARHEVAVDGLAAYHHRPQAAPSGIVIGYATPPEHAYAAAVSALVGTLQTYLRQHRGTR